MRRRRRLSYALWRHTHEAQLQFTVLGGVVEQLSFISHNEAAHVQLRVCVPHGLALQLWPTASPIVSMTQT